jgi:uncharacterized membrane protein YoaK (UPF0700 family)
MGVGGKEMRWTKDLLLLTWTAGTLDGLSYMSGHVFTANMTGNTVLLGFHAVQGQLGPSLHNVAALCAFVLGCFAGALILDETTPPKTGSNLMLAASIELPLLLAFAGLWLEGRRTHSLGYATIALAAVALGIQSVAVKRLKIRGVATTFITGTLTESASETVRAIIKRRRTGRWPADGSDAAVLAAMFAIYLVAAATAGYLSLHVPAVAAFLSVPTLLPVIFRNR